MSMLSVLCDRLRERAKELRNLAPDPDTPYIVPSTKETMALAMGSAASEMECAAETICELSNKLTGMVDERERVRLAEAENAMLRELVWDLYCLAYPSAVEWEATDAAWEKYEPCKKCHEWHGGKSPCASASGDMSEECCNPIQAAIVLDHMRDLGIEVD